jgi:hypothetical protein
VPSSRVSQKRTPTTLRYALTKRRSLVADVSRQPIRSYLQKSSSQKRMPTTLRYALTNRRSLVLYRRFRATYRSQLQRSSNTRRIPGPTGCPKTSVTANPPRVTTLKIKDLTQRRKPEITQPAIKFADSETSLYSPSETSTRFITVTASHRLHEETTRVNHSFPSSHSSPISSSLSLISPSPSS